MKGDVGILGAYYNDEHNYQVSPAKEQSNWTQTEARLTVHTPQGSEITP